MLAKIHPSWLPALQNEFQKPYMLSLNQFLEQENEQGAIVFPKPSDVFNAFNLTPFNEVKVVILGQDPYHGAKQAHGLSFSVQKGVAVPPSLRNIYKEPFMNKDILILVNKIINCESDPEIEQQGKQFLNNINNEILDGQEFRAELFKEFYLDIDSILIDNHSVLDPTTFSVLAHVKDEMVPFILHYSPPIVSEESLNTYQLLACLNDARVDYANRIYSLMTNQAQTSAQKLDLIILQAQLNSINERTQRLQFQYSLSPSITGSTSNDTADSDNTDDHRDSNTSFVSRKKRYR